MIRKLKLFEVEIGLGDSIRYTYGFEIDDYRVRGEWLYAYPRDRKQVWFERRSGQDDIEFPGEGLRGRKLELARLTRPDGLFLSVAAQLNHEQLLPVYEWFRDNLWLSTPEDNQYERGLLSRARLFSDAVYRDRISSILQVADLGIAGFDTEALDRGEIRFLHRSAGRRVPLEFRAESRFSARRVPRRRGNPRHGFRAVANTE